MAVDLYALGLNVFVEFNFPTHCGPTTHEKMPMNGLALDFYQAITQINTHSLSFMN